MHARFAFPGKSALLTLMPRHRHAISDPTRVRARLPETSFGRFADRVA
jgi:hypothetical protein